MSLSRIIKFTLLLSIISAYTKAGESQLELRDSTQLGLKFDFYISPPRVFGPSLPPKMAAERAKKMAGSSPSESLGRRVFSTIIGPPIVEFKKT